MKRLIYYFILLVSAFEIQAQYNVTMVSSKNGIITLRCVGYGKNAAKASKDAEISAIKALLFYGVADSQYRIALIQKPQIEVENNNKKFFEGLYNDEYKNFIESSAIVTPFGKNSLKQKCVTLDVVIRVSQLRLYLERNGIIRKFGL